MIASLLVVSLEFLAPLLLAPLVRDPRGLSFGPCLRIIPGGLASALAIVGMARYYGQG